MNLKPLVAIAALSIAGSAIAQDSNVLSIDGETMVLGKDFIMLKGGDIATEAEVIFLRLCIISGMEKIHPNERTDFPLTQTKLTNKPKLNIQISIRGFVPTIRYD